MLYCMCKELREAPYDSTIHLLYIFFWRAGNALRLRGDVVPPLLHNFLKRDG
nr:MAG TPA: hypothetical protein [Caudoviricetes sp.]